MEEAVEELKSYLDLIRGMSIEVSGERFIANFFKRHCMVTKLYHTMGLFSAQAPQPKFLTVNFLEYFRLT